LTPGKLTTVRLCMTDDENKFWMSRADFTADEKGRIDLNSKKPVCGDYAESDGMGLFRSMSLLPGRRFDEGFFKSDLYSLDAGLFAEVGGKVVAAIRFPIHRKGPGTEELLIREGGLAGIFIKSTVPGPRPGIITISGSGGGLGMIDHARFFARQGFSVLSLAYFNYGDLLRYLAYIPLEYFETVISWMQNQRDCQHNFRRSDFAFKNIQLSGPFMGAIFL
jgi:hypothetical protein